MAKPTKKIKTARFFTFQKLVFVSLKSYLRNEKNIETPMINIKKGKTKSVGVNPFHSAWRNGAYTYFQEPGLFTMIMPAMVSPRITSSESNLFETCVIFSSSLDLIAAILPHRQR